MNVPQWDIPTLYPETFNWITLERSENMHMKKMPGVWGPLLSKDTCEPIYTPSKNMEIKFQPKTRLISDVISSSSNVDIRNMRNRKWAKFTRAIAIIPAATKPSNGEHTSYIWMLTAVAKVSLT